MKHEPVYMTAADIDALHTAARDTLDALNAIYVDGFDVDDSGAREHVVEREVA